jgi:hypothetical protein
MHYIVTQAFYDAVSDLIGIASEDMSEVEIDLAMRLLAELEVDSPETREYYGK